MSRVMELAWRLLPPVGALPLSIIPGQEHLSARCGPLVVPAVEGVLVWGGSHLGQPLEKALGLVIGLDGTVLSDFELEWSAGDQVVLTEWGAVVCGPGSDGKERGLVFDPSAPDAVDRSPAPIASRRLTTPVRCETGIFVWGGEAAQTEDAWYPSEPFGDGAVFDPRTRLWAELPPAPIRARSWPVVQGLGGVVVVWGGLGARRDDVEALADGAVYDVARRAWRPMAPSPLAPRSGCSTAVLDGEVFIWGGESRGRYFGDGARYDPIRDTWSMLPEVPVRRSGMSTIALGDIVIMSGGTFGGGPDVNLLLYDWLEERWHLREDLSEFRPGAGCTFADLGDGAVYVWSCFNPTGEHAILVVRR